MKTLLFTLTLALMSFGAFALTSTAYACSSCGCMDTKQACNCGSKHVHGDKKCGCKSKAAHSHGDAKCGCDSKKMKKDKPCKVCEKSESAWNKKNKSSSMKDHSEKGSLTFKSRGSVNTGYNN